MLQEVLLHCDSDEDYDDDYLDDPDKPVMDGSDDEFSDLEGNDLDELEGDLDSGPNPSPNAGSPESYGTSASPGSLTPLAPQLGHLPRRILPSSHSHLQLV